MISARKLQLPKRQNAVVPPTQNPDHQEIRPNVVDPPQSSGPDSFRPPPLDTLDNTGLSESLVESLMFKHLFAAGHITGRGLSTSLGLPAKPIIELLAKFKAQQFVFHKDSTAMGDFDMIIYNEDYRAVDGVQYAHKSRVEIMGQKRLITIESIEHNVEMPKDRFKLPDEIKALVAKSKEQENKEEKTKEEKGKQREDEKKVKSSLEGL